MEIDQKTVDWIRRELASLEADEDYSPMIPGVEDLEASWEMENPIMYAELTKAGLLRQFAQVIQAKIWEERDDLELAGFPPTDAREQAERNWYLELEEQEVEPSPLAGLDAALNERLQIPLYR